MENSRLLAEMMNISATELGSVQLSRIQRKEFLASLLAYFGYHLDAINNISSLKILSEVF